MEILIGINVFTGHAQEEPVEEVGGFVGVEGILAGDEEEAFKVLLVDDSL